LPGPRIIGRISGRRIVVVPRRVVVVAPSLGWHSLPPKLKSELVDIEGGVGIATTDQDNR
jgi:hypothetical protein